MGEPTRPVDVGADDGRDGSDAITCEADAAIDGPTAPVTLASSATRDALGAASLRDDA